MSDNGNGYVTREVLLKKLPEQRRLIQIPELDSTILIKGMTALERGRFEASFLDRRTGESVPSRACQMRERLTIAVAINADGTNMFSLDDIKRLGEVDVRILDRICEAARDLCGMSDADFEDLVGNLDATSDDDSKSA